MFVGLLSGLTWAAETVLMGVVLAMSPFFSTPQAIAIAPFAATFLHDAFSALSLFVYNALRSKLKGFFRIFTKPDCKWLVLGAAIGGLTGKAIFDVIKAAVGEAPVGLIQSVALGVITLLTLFYMLCRAKIHTHNVRNPLLCALIGLVLGIMSSFLGIGGGPINLCVLYFFFSMDTKKAAANSLYTILFSQAASAVSTVVQGKIPAFSWLLLVLMVAGGVLGGMLGHRLNEKLSAKQVDKLFSALLVLIILICVYNAMRFAALL